MTTYTSAPQHGKVGQQFVEGAPIAAAVIYARLVINPCKRFRLRFRADGLLLLSAAPNDTDLAYPDFAYVIGGVTYGLPAGTVPIVGTVTGTKWGAYLVQVDATGLVTAKTVSDPQAYASEAAAIAAVPAPDAGNVAMGFITVHADVADWVAGFDVFSSAVAVHYQGADGDGALSVAYVRTDMGWNIPLDQVATYNTANPAGIAVTGGIETKLDVNPGTGESQILVAFAPVGIARLAYCDLMVVPSA